jgi:hypothetical protein
LAQLVVLLAPNPLLFGHVSTGNAMLNDTRIRGAKASERDSKLTDYDGLYLLVFRNRSRLWRFAYRFEGKQKQIAIGADPQVTSAEARERRETSHKLLASGKNPSLQRRLEKIAKAAGVKSFPEVAEERGDGIRTRSSGSWRIWKICAGRTMHTAEFWSERVEMMQVWADCCAHLWNCAAAAGGCNHAAKVGTSASA